MGLSIEAFADAVGVAPRTVAYWSSRPETEPRQAIQTLLDDLQLQHTKHRRKSTMPDSTCSDPVQTETDRFLAQSAQILPTIGADGIELLSGGVRGLARTYNTRSLLDEFKTAAQLQQQATGLVQRTGRPGEITDLYVTIAQLGALMASCAFDLGRSELAFQLTSASLLYAERCGDQSLAAWILGLQASLHLWGSQPSRALELASSGIDAAPAGQPQFRLRHIGARAAAAIGNREQALKLLRDAGELDSSRRDRLADEVGGEFHFDAGRAAACAAATWLKLGDWKQVMNSTRRAIDHYEEAPGGATRVPMLGARLDLTCALIRHGDIDAAGGQLAAAFAQAAEHRYSLVARVEQVIGDLQKQHGRRAEQLRQTACEWLSDVKK